MSVYLLQWMIVGWRYWQQQSDTGDLRLDTVRSSGLYFVKYLLHTVL